MVVNDGRSTINAKEKRLITDSPIKKKHHSAVFTKGIDLKTSLMSVKSPEKKHSLLIRENCIYAISKKKGILQNAVVNKRGYN